jgi:anaerobic selenocysteine-containing dehydrogenase
MVSAASHYFLNSSFGNVPSLRKRHGEPFVEIHPEDAAARGVADGDWVEIANDRGSFRARAKLGETVSPGSVFCPTVWWSQHAPDGRGANWTTNDELADYAGGATFHGNLIQITRVERAPAGVEPAFSLR